jgi:hypothetical protein
MVGCELKRFLRGSADTDDDEAGVLKIKMRAGSAGPGAAPKVSSREKTIRGRFSGDVDSVSARKCW